MKTKIWEILNKDEGDIVEILLKNRGFKTKKEKDEFFSPTSPEKFTLKALGISGLDTRKAIKRIKKAQRNKEKVIVYGDYDADGISATAIIWEALDKFGVDALPYIPDRFEEGYGINAKSIENLKLQNPNLKLVVTVDNGIVAYDGIEAANKLGIDVIVTDHHVPDMVHGKSSFPNAYAVIHTTKIAGSAVSWILARELGYKGGLELAAIGTIADQMPLVAENRSFAYWGIKELNKTRRVGLHELMRSAQLELGNVDTYAINYIIAPRINAMGRLASAIESLRLLCTKDIKRARDLAKLVTETNLERQDIVEKISKSVASKAKRSLDRIIFISDKNYHEGVIGLAAGRLVEEFYTPAIVVAIGKEFSKGSARSISGFNIVNAVREYSGMLVAHGGHAMAAGFTIETSKLERFKKKINESAKKMLTKDLLTRKLKVDEEIKFGLINWELVKKIKKFEPTGNGNPKPSFAVFGVKVIDIKFLGKDKNHLKLKLSKDDNFFDAIGFGMVKDFEELQKGDLVDIAFNIEENEWNGVKSLQLRIKDIHHGK